MQAIRIHATGGPEALKLEDIELPEPGRGEVLLKQTAIGINFIDVYHRTGLYPLTLPGGIGIEAAGIVEKAGQGVEFAPGDRIAYCGGPPGAYATHRIIAAKHLVRLPDSISDAQAAASMLKGLTAHYLLHRTLKVGKGHTVLIHAAAGGVGLILCRWAKYLGATVIGTVGTNEKAALAGENGCDHAIIYTRENFTEQVRALTGGQGVDVVYDSVGKSTFMGSLDCLKRFGMMVSFGNASGAVPPFEPALLLQKGSLYLTRPTLLHHIEDRSYYEQAAAELFSLIGKSVINVRVGATYPLTDAAQAHRDLEARKTMGALVLIP